MQAKLQKFIIFYYIMLIWWLYDYSVKILSLTEYGSTYLHIMDVPNIFFFDQLKTNSLYTKQR